MPDSVREAPAHPPPHRPKRRRRPIPADAYAREDGTVLVELDLKRPAQLFNTLDPSPFHERELEAAADGYIVGAARDVGDMPFKLVLRLPEEERARPEARHLGEAIRNHFAYRAKVERQRLRLEFQRGRTSLVIGLIFLLACLGLREILLAPGATGLARIASESLLIVGWVAMWGPLEVFLYGWWPIARTCRLLERLAGVAVEVRAAR